MPGCRETRPWHALVITLAMLCCAQSAWASSGEQELWFGAGADDAIQPSVHGRYLYDQSDFWSYGVGLEHRLDGPLTAGRTAALAELRMVIDALTFVPALSLVGGAAMTWPSADVVGLVRLEASAAWRPARAWGLMLRIGAERELVAEGATMIIVSLAWGRFFGGASDLDL